MHGGVNLNTQRGILLSIMLISFLAPLSAIAVSYTLQICGNANMDETINDADVSYIEKVIKGEAEETKLSDANNDGMVNEKDVDQIKGMCLAR
jgi:iron complex transport system substrate-binding protein